MSDKSAIEWTDATWNPIRGCSVVSEGCRNCYAMQVAARFNQPEQAYEGLAYRNDSGAHWTGEVRLVEKHLFDPLRWMRPRRIFVNSMSDLFHESIPDKWIFQIFDVMYSAKRHIFQVLTKRPERMLRVISNSMYLTNSPLDNVWLGVSVEDQKTADERVPLLMKTPSAVRFVSAEPLLGPIDLEMLTDGPDDGGGWVYRHWNAFDGRNWCDCRDSIHPIGSSPINWVIVGGESGPKARPMHPDWARSLRDQCVSAGIPFFFKQWGEWANVGECDDPCGRCVMAKRAWNGTAWRGSELTGTEWEAGSHLTGALQLHPVGKKAAGRLLDGREWNEYPAIAEVPA